MVAMDAATTEDIMSFTIIRTYQVKRSTGFVYELNGRRAASFARSAEALASSLGVKTMTKPMTLSEVQTEAYAIARQNNIMPVMAELKMARGTAAQIKHDLPLNAAQRQICHRLDQLQAAYEADGWACFHDDHLQLDALEMIEEVLAVVAQEGTEYPQECADLVGKAKTATAREVKSWRYLIMG